eukprot:2681853-Prorocentrum_lima.AAC.1
MQGVALPWQGITDLPSQSMLEVAVARDLHQGHIPCVRQWWAQLWGCFHPVMLSQAGHDNAWCNLGKMPTV